eukprot:TRINITY_DN37478_c0_g1_i1.p1 TRINITY_DN37478_c0_g1~~TRINITY_DN37478_c0_g1_i1.p1  ORF type:complete len:954 (-),score=177.51 TRINITY_DN37478_c0_g1_i1:128-2989(-)
MVLLSHSASAPDFRPVDFSLERLAEFGFSRKEIVVTTPRRSQYQQRRRPAKPTAKAPAKLELPAVGSASSKGEGSEQVAQDAAALETTASAGKPAGNRRGKGRPQGLKIKQRDAAERPDSSPSGSPGLPGDEGFGTETGSVEDLLFQHMYKRRLRLHDMFHELDTVKADRGELAVIDREELVSWMGGNLGVSEEQCDTLLEAAGQTGDGVLTYSDWVQYLQDKYDNWKRSRIKKTAKVHSPRAVARKEEWECPQCGTENKGDAIRCYECGSTKTEGGASRRLTKPPGPLTINPTEDGEASDDSVDRQLNMTENIRLRKLLHRARCELQACEKELDTTRRDLRQALEEVDELRLKHGNLERADRTKSAELLNERRRCDELSKQVKAMSQNLLGIMTSRDAEASGDKGSQDSGLQKRCFKLVQQNTALTVQSQLLRRQKDWAEAKAAVMQDEVTRVYLGTHKQVKDDRELQNATEQQFNVGSQQGETKVYKLRAPKEYKHKEAVVDFLTHIAHTNGQDVHGFLQGSRVYSEGIRLDCLSGLGREFYACLAQNRLLPQILGATERICHLGDYLTAFETFSLEVTRLLNCSQAKLWVVDHVQHCIWTCWRDGENTQRFQLPLPKGRAPDDLKGQGIAVASCVLQKPINLPDVRQDPRFKAEADASVAGSDGLATSILCVPVIRDNKVRVVLQASNKLREPSFDPSMDVRVLRLLGKVAGEVLQICQENSTASTNAKRKETLLQLFTEHVPCTEPLQLLQAVESGLKDMFLAQSVALFVVDTDPSKGKKLVKLQMESRGGGSKKVVKTPIDGLRGIAGQVVMQRNQMTLLGSKLESATDYDSTVDLAVGDHSALHSVPILDGSDCQAVIQFLCQEKSSNSLGDDGAFHSENTSHYKILVILLNFVQKHLSSLDHLIRPSELDGLDYSAHLSGSDEPESRRGSEPTTKSTNGASSRKRK